MSSVSQTPPQAKPGPRPKEQGFGRRLLIGVAVIAGIVGVAIAPNAAGIVELALNARPHAPDLALLAALPLAIQLHIAAAFAALALGAVLMLRRKGRLFHRAAGWLWVGLVSLVAGSSLFITSMNHGRFSILHVFTAWTLIVLPLAVTWAKRHEVARHRRTMMGLFYGGFAINFFIAFIPGRTLWQAVFG